jgi:hypothetical protein
VAKSETALLQAFNQRYGLSQAQKWRTEKDMWTRDQKENESVDDYVTAMQLTANRVSMPTDQLQELIIQGLKPELRLFVLNSRVHDIPELLTIARTCEAARMVDKPPAINSSIELLTNLVGALTTQVAKLTTANELAHTQAAIQTTDTRQPKNFTNKKQRQWQPREDQQQQQQSQNPWQASPVQQQWTSQNPQQTSGWSQPLPVPQQQQQQYVAAPTNQKLPTSNFKLSTTMDTFDFIDGQPKKR